MTDPVKKQLRIDDLLAIRHRVREKQPVIHCLTNHISIGDCANALLAVFAWPIMAEYPPEVSGITAGSDALCVNLGNISAARMQAMMLSGKTARERRIPCVIDLVGVACSPPRLDFARDFVRECRPGVIKGNASELRAFGGLPSHARGVDAGDEDRTTEHTLAENAAFLGRLAEETGAVVAATGAIDLVADGKDAYALRNGCPMLSRITGTGCMLGALTAGFLSGGDLLGGVLLAFGYLGVCGELARTEKGPASFHTELMDLLYRVTDDQLRERLRCGRYERGMETCLT